MPVEEVVKVSRNYQVTIPAKVRQKFPVKEGDLVKVIYDENEGVVKIQILRAKTNLINHIFFHEHPLIYFINYFSIRFVRPASVGIESIY